MTPERLHVCLLPLENAVTILRGMEYYSVLGNAKSHDSGQRILSLREHFAWMIEQV